MIKGEIKEYYNTKEELEAYEAGWRKGIYYFESEILRRIEKLKPKEQGILTLEIWNVSRYCEDRLEEGLDINNEEGNDNEDDSLSLTRRFKAIEDNKHLSYNELANQLIDLFFSYKYEKVTDEKTTDIEDVRKLLRWEALILIKYVLSRYDGNELGDEMDRITYEPGERHVISLLDYALEYLLDYRIINLDFYERIINWRSAEILEYFNGIHIW